MAVIVIRYQCTYIIWEVVNKGLTMWYIITICPFFFKPFHVYVHVRIPNYVEVQTYFKKYT